MGSRNIVPVLSIVKEGWKNTLFLAKFFCFLHVTNTYLITPVQTYGPSMLPAIDLTPAIFFGERISTRFGKVACGDIVALRTPQNPRRCITKRVVGMEGDSVTYVSDPKNSDKHETVVVPKGHVWVQGDNLHHSKDSREFGPVPYGLIESRVFWKVFPLDGFGPFWKK